MPHAVVLDLDPHAALAVEDLADRIAAKGTSLITPGQLGMSPHLTLAVYPDTELKGIERKLEIFAAAAPILHVNLANVDYFPGEHGVIFIAPNITPELLAFHERYHVTTRRFGSGDAYYHPGNWVPHVTVAVNVPCSELAAISEDASKHWLAIACSLVAVRLIRYHPVETLWSAEVPQL